MKPAILVALLVFFELFALCIAEPRMTSPSEFLGYQIGTQLTPWNKEIEYFRTLDRESDLIKVETFGNSTEGKEMILVIFFDGDAEKNLRQVKRLGEPIGDDEARSIADSAAPIVFLNCDIHSSEYEDTESVMQFAYELLTAYKDKLEDVMVVINPSINPDGHDIYRQWYSEYKGTEYAGTQPPNYHAYVGHDLNRDWHEGNTVEMRNMWSAFLEYSPQIFIDNHMMGSRGYRMYIAPECDPVNPEINPVVQMEKYMLAGYIMSEFERNNCPGVVFEEEFDLFFPGYGDSWPSLHNALGCTWEIATGRGPESTTIAKEDLSEGARLRSEHQPTPWEGGLWSFEEQIRYRLVGWRALMNVTSSMSEEILYNYYLMEDADRNGSYVIPFAQRDTYALNKAMNKLIAQGVEVRVNESAFIVPEKSPLARALLGVQSLEQPYFYDVTAWNYGLAKGLDIDEIGDLPESEKTEMANVSTAKVSGSGTYYIFNRTLSAIKAVNDLFDQGEDIFVLDSPYALGNVTFDAGSFAVKEPFDVYQYGTELFGANISEPSALKEQRIAIYSTNRSGRGSMDEGWTRLVMDEFGFDYDVITDLGSLDHDILIIPEESSVELLINGSRDYPLKNGLGTKGLTEIKNFVEEGGRLLTWGESSVILERFSHINVVENNATVPGSFFMCSFERDPMTYGTMEEQPAFFWGNLTFEGAESLATIESPSAGYVEGFDALKNKSCMTRTELGKGEMIAYAFLPQYRASVDGSFMLFFNGLYDCP